MQFLENISWEVGCAMVSSIGTVVCAALALWNNPNLFHKFSIKIEKVNILKSYGNKLYANIVLRNKRNFNFIINEVVLLIGKKKQVLAFAPDNDELLPMCSKKEFILSQKQTYGEDIFDKTTHIKNIDVNNIKSAVIYIETLSGPYHRKLKKNEINNFISIYKQIKK